MSWRDREWGREESFGAGGRPGGDWRGLLPRLDNPMSWSVWIGRYFGIDVRVHVILLIFVIAELFSALFGAADRGTEAPLGPFYVFIMLGSLFVLVLLHEFGHCFACRSVGGEANEILMWPLGGLAYCMPPHRWTAHLATVAGGPLVNVALMVVFAIPLLLMTNEWLVAIPLPFLGYPEWFWGSPPGWVFGLYLAARVNMILLLFNLLPMFPMDGGRFMQSLLWPRIGYMRSMRIAVYSGYFAAIGLVIYGWVTVQLILIGVGIFGGITCWMTIRQLRYTQEVMGFESEEYLLGDVDEEERHSERGGTGREDAGGLAKAKKESKRRQREAEKLLKQQQQDEAELDRLLRKIADSGMGSLNRRERTWLERHSKRKRSSGE